MVGKSRMCPDCCLVISCQFTKFKDTRSSYSWVDNCASGQECLFPCLIDPVELEVKSLRS
jgi:hypothetical protein